MKQIVEMGIRCSLGRVSNMFLACALTACVAKVPPSKKDIIGVDVPQSYSSKLDQSAVATDWVSQLSGDRMLKELIEDVTRNNWDIKKAAVRVETAAANARI